MWRAQRQRLDTLAWLGRDMTDNPIGVPEGKQFRPVNPDVPVLDDYREVPRSFFEKYFKLDNDEQAWPYPVDTGVLLERAEAAGVVNLYDVRRTCWEWENGFDIGVESEGFVHSNNPNNESVYGEYGPQVMDALVSWNVNNVIIGPKWKLPENVTVIKMTCREKGPGRCPIIMDQSAPRRASTNDAIDGARFPADMGGMQGVLDCFNYVGRGSRISKCDWCDAYKHVGIRQSQWQYQWFCYGGAYFVEKCSTFGCKSSPGNFCRCARLLVTIVREEMDLPAVVMSMHLDDLIMGGARVEELTRRYRALCAEVGVRLQGHDPGLEKAFDASKAGVCLGVYFDLEEWRWCLTEGKIVKYTAAIDEMLWRKVATVRELKQVTGKIMWIEPLWEGSRFYVNELLRLANCDTYLEKEVVVDEGFKSQLRWWRVAMQFLRRGLAIPAGLGAGRAPRGALVADSDAAGGAGRDARKGVGAVLGKAFVVTRWPKVLGSSKVCPECGVQWRYKMSMMELVGWTLVICCFPREVMNKAVVVQIDNEGTICHVRKGYDAKCRITSALLRATYEVSRGLNAEAYARKVTRCSARGPVLADQLSKGLKDEFEELWMQEEGVEMTGREIPPVLMWWLQHPTVDNDLGTKILRYMRRKRVPVMLAE